MKNTPISHLLKHGLFLLSLFLYSCDYDEPGVMDPSGWASIFVIAAVLLFFYYLFKLRKRR